MAVTPFKTFSAGEVLTASDLNSSITAITNGAMSLVSPAAASLDMNAQSVILDLDGDTLVIADTDDRVDWDIGGYASMVQFDRTGTPNIMALNDDAATATAGPKFVLGRFSATPADNDFIGFFAFRGRDDALATVEYVQVGAKVLDVTAGTEDSELYMSSYVAGTLAQRLVVAAGAYTAGAGGGDQGVDTINASKLYLDGTPFISSGSGTPESAVTAPIGSLFMRTDGGAGTTLYVKESGSGNTGWAGV